MTAGQARITRARSAVGTARYKLGKGGYHPADPWPARKALAVPKDSLVPVLARWCDCSGFVSWVLGLSRATTIVPGMWGISTDSLHRDATGPQLHLRLVPRAKVRPGDLATYPDHRGPDGKTRQGHTGVVVDPDRRLVIDCGSSAGGITERVLLVFWTRSDTVFCRPITDDQEAT